MLAAVASKALGRGAAGRAALVAFACDPAMTTQPGGARSLAAQADGSDRPPLTEQIKEAARKVPGAVSGVMDKAKSFVHEAAERVRYDQEGYVDAIKAQADKAQAAAGRVMGSATDTSEAAAQAAAEGNAAAVNSATGGEGMSNPLTGHRGPSAVEGTGGEEVRKQMEQGHTDQAEPTGAMPAGTLPINEKGPHLVTDRDGQQSSHT